MFLRVAAVVVAVVATSTCAAAAADTPSFVHPGVFVDADRLASIRTQALDNKSGPVYDAYEKALASRFGGEYKLRGPPASGVIECGSYSHPDFGCSEEAHDSAAAYLQSLLWAINGDKQLAENAVAILNAYAYGVHEYNNSNAPLQAAWSAMQFTKAAELLAHGRGANASLYNESDQDALVSMLYKTTVPLIEDGSGANGNWELSMLDALFGLAVLDDNRTLFDHTAGLWRQRLPAYFYLHALDGGAPVPPPRGHPTWYGQEVYNVSIDGHCQETCRDLGHTQMGFASAIDGAVTAGLQGTDLLGEQDTQARITAAMEYHAAYFLGGAVPEFVCPQEEGVGTVSSSPTFEVAYDFYHRQRGVALPLSAKHIAEQVRTQSDPASPLIFVYETLSHGGPL